MPDAQQPTSPADASTEELFSVLYRELHTLAERHLRKQGAGFTLGTTTLLHELYLQLSERDNLQFPDRPRFLGYASRAMRGLVIDYVRRRSAAKRGGEFQLSSLEDDQHADPSTEAQNLTAIGEALDRLSTIDAPLAELVDLHFFCGLTFADIAGLRKVSTRTINRDWQRARLFLHSELRPMLPEADPDL